MVMNKQNETCVIVVWQCLHLHVQHALDSCRILYYLFQNGMTHLYLSNTLTTGHLAIKKFFIASKTFPVMPNPSNLDKV